MAFKEDDLLSARRIVYNTKLHVVIFWRHWLHT